MVTRPLALTELLLITAPLRGLPEVKRRAPHFDEVWRAVVKGDAVALKLHTAAAKDLLRAALSLCEAAGIDRADLTQFYNDRRDAGEFGVPADLDALFTTAAENFLAMLARAENEGTQET